MAAHQPGNYEVPNTVSFLALLFELERRKTRSDERACDSGTFPDRASLQADRLIERDVLHKQLLDLEHCLEQRLLFQLENALLQEESWWKKLCRQFILRVNSVASAFSMRVFQDDLSTRHDSHKHQV